MYKRDEFLLALSIECERAKCLAQGQKTMNDSKELYLKAWTYEQLLNYADKFPNDYMGDIIEGFIRMTDNWSIEANSEDVRYAYRYARDTAEWLMDLYRFY